MIRLRNKLIRINPNDPRELLFSENDGTTWFRLTSENFRFLDLMDNRHELVAETSNGLYFSTNEGRTWFRRSL